MHKFLAYPLMAVAGLMAVSLVASPFVDDPKSASSAGPQASAVPTYSPETVPPVDAVVPSARPSATRKAAVVPLLHQAAYGDGDSWKDTAGKEYRLGLVNTPEQDECGGTAATNKRQALLVGGFRATVYQTDSYGRAVSEVFTASGLNLNVYLARYGFANDTYLDQYRAERPALAAQLDSAFAAARAEKRGVWATCAPAAAPTKAPVAQGNCHRDYLPCIPVKGTGSGAGEANDLDCGDIRVRVQLRQVGVDPYRLDNNGDGFGCDSYG